MTTLDWHGRTYFANGALGSVTVGVGLKVHMALNEAEAVVWLTNHSLRKGKARALVTAEMDKNAIVMA